MPTIMRMVQASERIDTGHARLISLAIGDMAIDPDSFASVALHNGPDANSDVLTVMVTTMPGYTSDSLHNVEVNNSVYLNINGSFPYVTLVYEPIP